VDKLVLSLPEHKAGLQIDHNINRSYYETVEKHLYNADGVNDPDEAYDWPSPEDKQKAIDDNEMWSMIWYPHTPVGSHHIASSTLFGLLEMAEKYGKQVKYIHIGE
jgi:hypothetical protein